MYIYGGMGPEYGSTSVQLDDVQVESALNLTVSRASSHTLEIYVAYHLVTLAGR